MNNVLENNFFSRIGRLISRPKSRFPIEQQPNLDIQFTRMASEEEVEMVTYVSQSRDAKFVTNPLPNGTLGLAAFRTIVETESALSNSSFLIEMRLNQGNCSFLTDVDRRDLAIDCLKKVIGIGLSENAYTFSPSQKIWLLYTNVSADSAINKANMAFRQVQQLVREELDFHQSLLELNMFNLQDCVPEIS